MRKKFIIAAVVGAILIGGISLHLIREALMPTYTVTVTNQSGSENVVGTDNLMVNVTRGDGVVENYSYLWYRNGIPLEGATSQTLTNEAMKTFTGNPDENTPQSSHTGHTIRGYEFKVEIYNTEGRKVGEDSVTIGGSTFAGEMRGVNFANWDLDWASEEKSDHSLETLTRTNINWISLWSAHYQDGPDATEIYARSENYPNTIGENQLIHQIEKAHKLGLKVVLYPQIWIAYADGSASPAERPNIVASDEWFVVYENFIFHQADIAEQTNVDLFTIGVELESTVGQENKWLEIISGVRARYSGSIIYSPIACHDDEIERLENIDWFASLDYLGLSSNLETRSENYDPTVEGLVAEYSRMAQKMENIYNKFAKPVIITETCIPSLDGGTISPRDWRENVPDFQEQADYYEAFFETFADKTWVKGIFWNEWNCSQETWYQDDSVWPLHNAFLNKPAERVLTSWYGGV